MIKALFKPFDIGKWFVLGFTAFLAQLMESCGNRPFSGSSYKEETARVPDIGQIPERTADWIQSHPFWVAVILMGILVFIAVILVFTWLSSRGAFMFLDNVVHDRALVVKPWREYSVQGNSLFCWRVGFGIVLTLFVLTSLALIFIQVVQFSRGRYPMENILFLMLIVLLWLLGSVTVAYISLFTNSFVVPIMYKHNLRILQAWQKFLPILKSHFIYFILYGLFFLLLFIVIILAAVLAGCLTCCCGFILLSLPYIGSVCLLPASFTMRALPLEFLAQWGTDYAVFPEGASSPDNVPPPPIPPPAGVNASGM
jgi:hypothetical protein